MGPTAQGQGAHVLRRAPLPSPRPAVGCPAAPARGAAGRPAEHSDAAHAGQAQEAAFAPRVRAACWAHWRHAGTAAASVGLGRQIRRLCPALETPQAASVACPCI